MSTVDTLHDTSVATAEETNFKENRRGRELKGRIFAVIIFGTTIFGLIMLAFLISDVIYEAVFFRMPGDHVVVQGEVAGDAISDIESIIVVDPINRLQSESRSRTAGIVGTIEEVFVDDEELFLRATAQGDSFRIGIDDAQLSATPETLVGEKVLAVGERNGSTRMTADTVEALTDDVVAGMVINRTADTLTIATDTGEFTIDYDQSIDITFPGVDERSLERALEDGIESRGYEEIEELDAETLARVKFDDLSGTVGYLRADLVTEYPSRRPSEAGMRSGIIGSLIVIGLTALFSFPLGVGAALYLEEYAPKNWFTSFIQINLSNLAGVPSIVYGMLGLALFVRMFRIFAPGSWLVETFNLPVGDGTGGLSFNLLGLPFLPIELPFGRSLLAGGLTMTLLILPVVIIAAREAIRAVPPSIREAAYGLGATRWQVVSRQVLPIAMPGILTGMILALSRAIGETAPLIIMGAFTFIAFMPENIWDSFTVMPIQIYNWIAQPQQEFQIHLAAAAIIILLAIMLSMNTIAIILRRRFEIKW